MKTSFYLAVIVTLFVSTSATAKERPFSMGFLTSEISEAGPTVYYSADAGTLPGRMDQYYYRLRLSQDGTAIVAIEDLKSSRPIALAPDGAVLFFDQVAASLGLSVEPEDRFGFDPLPVLGPHFISKTIEPPSYIWFSSDGKGDWLRGSLRLFESAEDVDPIRALNVTGSHIFVRVNRQLSTLGQRAFAWDLMDYSFESTTSQLLYSGISSRTVFVSDDATHVYMQRFKSGIMEHFRRGVLVETFLVPFTSGEYVQHLIPQGPNLLILGDDRVVVLDSASKEIRAVLDIRGAIEPIRVKQL